MNEMILLDYSRIQNTWARDCRGPGLAWQQERLEDWTWETDLSSVLLAWPPPAAWWGQRGEALLGSGRESWGVLGNLSAGRAGRQTGVLSYWWARPDWGKTLDTQIVSDETRRDLLAVLSVWQECLNFAVEGASMRLLFPLWSSCWGSSQEDWREQTARGSAGSIQLFFGWGSPGPDIPPHSPRQRTDLTFNINPCISDYYHQD